MPGVYKGAKGLSNAQELTYGRTGSNLVSSDEHNESSGNSSKPLNLDLLWEALPFTPAIKHGSHGHLEYSHTSVPGQMPQQVQQQHQQQQVVQVLQQPVAAAATSAQPESPQRQQQPVLAPLLQPKLVTKDHQNLTLMANLVAQAINAAVTAEEARAGYEQAFAAVAAPAGTTWHLGKFARVSSWQQRQQKGAEYIDANGSPSSSSSSRGLVSMRGAGEEGESAAGEQQRSLQAQAAAQQLMMHALQLLKDSGRLADCGTEDDSLPPLLQQSGAAGGSGLASRVLLAAALQQSEEAMPNMVLQLVLVSGGLHETQLGYCCLRVSQ